MGIANKAPSIRLAILILFMLYTTGIVLNPKLPSIIALTIFLMVGFIIPFKSLYLTWWLYTLGGITPIPEQHKWLLKSLDINKNRVLRTSAITTLTILGVSIGQMLYFGYFKFRETQMVLFFQLLIPLLTFGLSLTLATAIKRKQYLP